MLESSEGAWRRSTRCGPNGGNCVEVNLEPESPVVGVRDSKDVAAGYLAFDAQRWNAFLGHLRTGKLDGPAA